MSDKNAVSLSFFKKVCFHSALFLFATILLMSSSNAQTIIRDSLYSEVLKEERKIQVVWPKSYSPTADDTFEVVYCLDDISNYQTMEWDFLQGEGFIPKNMIMIGITNPKPGGLDMRDRDFTPTKLWDITGGAYKFHQFIKTELIPFVNLKYKAANTGNVLYGGSLGGLYVMYNLLYDPELFTSYIAIDPSLWWDNFLMAEIAPAKLDSLTNVHNTLFIAGREGNAYREMGIAKMDSVLRAKAPKGLDWRSVIYTNETHYSTNFKGFWDGLKFSYGGFYASTGGYSTSRKIVLKPKTGIVLKDVPFKFISYNLEASTYLHYTTDGTEPTRSSPTLTGEETSLSLTRASKVIVKSIGVRTQYNRIDSAYFKIGETWKPMLLPKDVKSGGLRYAYYEGTWNSFPDIKKEKPLREGVANKDFDLNKNSGKANFALVMTGYLKIERKGYYILEMGGGNQHSKVYLNNQLILGKFFIKDDGETFVVPLEAGYYPFRIEYFHKKGDADLAPIYMKPEGLEDFQIPVEILYARNK